MSCKIILKITVIAVSANPQTLFTPVDCFINRPQSLSGTTLLYPTGENPGDLISFMGSRPEGSRKRNGSESNDFIA